MSAPWICPRCERVNAPFIPHCDCKRVVDDITQNQTIGPGPAQFNPRVTDCPRCWQHGISRTHGLMEVCPSKDR